MGLLLLDIAYAGIVTAQALIVNRYNVRAIKKNLNDIKLLEVTQDAELCANSLPASCYRVSRGSLLDSAASKW